MGALEGTSMDATRQLFELNTFGTMAMTWGPPQHGRSIVPGHRLPCAPAFNGQKKAGAAQLR